MRHEADPGEALVALYDRALPQVYGYLFDRCGDRATAEDLTSETFLAAVAAVKRPAAEPVSVPWLIGVARHKLADHWRGQARRQRLEDRVAGEAAAGTGAAAGAGGGTGARGGAGAADDPWDAQLDRLRAADALARLGGHHRAALTLRYVDGLPVPEVAELLGRTVHATEALLVRARRAFRSAHDSGTDHA